MLGHFKNFFPGPTENIIFFAEQLMMQSAASSTHLNENSFQWATQGTEKSYQNESLQVLLERQSDPDTPYCNPLVIEENFNSVPGQFKRDSPCFPPPCGSHLLEYFLGLIS